MSNLAAVLPSEKAPLEVQEVEKYTPSGREILVKNEVFAFNPVEFKMAKLAIFPLQYPAILGATFAGTVEEIGPEVTDFKIGDKVVVTNGVRVSGNQYKSYQQYVLVGDNMISKLPAEIDLAVPVSLMMNLTCVVGMFTGRLGLNRPPLDGSAPAYESSSTTILVYGGSSSFGSLSVEYLAQAGYKVVTTASPKNQYFVAKLGAAAIIDHTLKPDNLVKQLVAEGPYDIVVDSISLPNTVPITSKVLAAQGGGKLYALQPAFGPETLPDGVTRVFEPWSEPLYEEMNLELQKWTIQTYIPQGLSKGLITALPTEKVKGGLKGVNEALGRLQKGVSGVRLVADPWE